MIRIASFLVFVIGAAFAFGAFYLARGSERDAPQSAAIPAAQQQQAAPETPPAPPTVPDAEKLFYLQDIDFEQGEITVLFHALGPEGDNVILRDQTALRAAVDQTFVTVTPDTNSPAWSQITPPSSDTLLQVFRSDILIATLGCPTPCTTLADHANLLDTATPYRVFNDTFDDHATYLATISAISDDPNFMLLDQRPTADFPAPEITPTLTISLPTAVIQSVDSFDSTVFRALITDAVSQHLPEGATITAITVADLHPAYVADKDNGQFVTAGGQPIAFPDARFLPVSVDISGTDRLSDAAYDAITDATTLDFDVDAQFETFVKSRLLSDCVDCFFLKVNGPFYQSTRPTAQTRETYTLDYYDLREAP